MGIYAPLSAPPPEAAWVVGNFFIFKAFCLLWFEVRLPASRFLSLLLYRMDVIPLAAFCRMILCLRGCV